MSPSLSDGFVLPTTLNFEFFLKIIDILMKITLTNIYCLKFLSIFNYLFMKCFHNTYISIGVISLFKI